MQQVESSPNVRWGEWIGEGWRMFADRWQVWVVDVLIFILAIVVPIVFLQIAMFATGIGASINAQQTGAPPELPPGMFLFLPVVVIVMLLATAFLMGGMWRTCFKQMRGEQISVRDLFSGGDVFLRIIGAFLALGVIGAIGVLLCFFPAFIFMGLFYFTIPLIVERDMSIGDALSASYNATKGHWFMFTLFALVVTILASIGQYACMVGWLVTYPLQFTIVAVAYRDIFGIPGARSFNLTPVSSATSYAGQDWSAPGQSNWPPQAPPQPMFGQQPSSVVEGETARLDPPPPNLQCPHCGAALARVATFCNFCGNRLPT